ncbi:thrombospondin, type I, domain containing 7Ab [Gadus morhua]|uniref:thrombospondin, type I, domain containing 7Ab n=1 Tax=Gadus morhua TaxID=8049 RepID=UPI0011B66E45|nr:thrombospondin type-1 domain-containing protein 7A-like [Gadus morhua]
MCCASPGPWGRCMGSDCGPGGSQSRAVWCAHVDGWTTLHTNCDQAQRPSNQRNCFRVCDWHKDLYDWQLGAWNQCVPVSARANGAPQLALCHGGEEGTQLREVGCALRADGSPADDAICEYFEPKPRLEQACLIPCPQDCVVSQYSPWTSCSKTCGTGLKNRVRSVLVPPMFGGAACPNLTEFHTCRPGPCSTPEGVYSLRIGPWGPCALPLTRPARQAKRRRGKGPGGRDKVGLKDPEARELIQKKRTRNRLNRQESPFWDIQVGYQTRDVTCNHWNGTTVELHECTPMDLPHTVQSCLLPKDCQLSAWSAWGPCSNACSDPEAPGGARSRGRSVLQFAIGEEGVPCEALGETEACEPPGEGPLPPCPTYTWRSTEWSDCRVDLLLSQQDRRRGNQTGLCGGGLQTREVYCVQGNAEILTYLSDLRDKDRASPPVQNQLCQGPVPSRSQLCHLPCPTECQVSPWGAWGPCTFENCDDQAGKKGFKIRRRRVTNAPTGGPGSCPHLLEAVPCEDPRCHDWRLVSLDRCRPDDGKPCGPGAQTPQIQCVNSSGGEVDKSLCSSSLPPELVPCLVPCSRDCVLSDWTPWSSCSQTCSSKTIEGKQMRTRSILAYNAGEGGAPCPNCSALQEVRNCNEHACTVYHWQTGPWGTCTEDPNAGTTNSTVGEDLTSCSTGVQTRKVICVRVNVGQVPPKKCPEGPRPGTIRPCSLPCKKDCIVTPFSDWTSCPPTCDTAVSSVKQKQTRSRLVIQFPANGGQDCPEPLEEERDCEAPKVCPGYRWKTHKWRKCQLVPWFLRQFSPGAQESCGSGLQTRAVSCRRLDGAAAELAECLLQARSMPPATQRCVIPCQDDCQLTSWSKFTPCSADCVGVRTRKRALIGRSKKKDRCKNGQMYPQSETQYCPCDKYNAQPVGEWSDCILAGAAAAAAAAGAGAGAGGRPERLPGLRVQAEVRECGQGYRYQAMVCYDQDGRLVETSRCNSHAGELPLSLTSTDFRGRMEKESLAIAEAAALSRGGEEAPPALHVFHRQTHSHRGVHVHANNETQTHETTHTQPLQHHHLTPACLPPLPPQPCTRMLSRVRTAFTIRAPSMGRQCPETTDAEACALNLNCFNYFYNITDWSTCQLSASAVCGTGTKTRMLDCVRSDGKSVNLKFCEELNLDRKWQMNTSCVVECPVNCQLSEWSVWSECSQTCGLQGKMWRQRSVVQAPQGDGRPCSPQMQQWKPCPARPCYQWQHGAWSECRVEGDVACGHGLRHRNTSCFVSDGSGRAPPSLVEEELCSGLQAVADGNKEMRLVESCTLPCPGECYLMEWSEWNPCVSVCAKEAGVDFGSVQVRVRPVMAQEPQNLQLCPDQAWESRPCTDGACYEYTWKSVRKTNSTEFNTWCQRSDGVNVTGGCPPINPPGDNSSCDPPCLSPKSFCSEAALCQCEEGYTEVLFFTGQLNHCAPIPVVEVPTAGDKKGDVKTSRAVNPTPPSTIQPGRSGRTWYLQPYGQDGKLKMWVYGVAAGATVLVLFIASMIYLACRSCAKVRRALKAEEAPCNGAVVWIGGDAHELTYTCPECQQSAHSEAVD